jgi:hypothetical protein
MTAATAGTTSRPVLPPPDGPDSVTGLMRLVCDELVDDGCIGPLGVDLYDIEAWVRAWCDVRRERVAS